MGRDRGAGTIPCVGEESEMLEASVGWGGVCDILGDLPCDSAQP